MSMIQELRLNADAVCLRGVSLKSSFFIHNPNNEVALSFAIDPLYYFSKQLEGDSTASHIASVLSVFPRAGLLLPGETQKVVIKAKNSEEMAHGSLSEPSLKLCVKYQTDNNFNKILLRNRDPEGIENRSLMTYQGLKTITVHVGNDYSRVQQQILNSVLASSSLTKELNNISVIASSQQYKEEDEHELGEIIKTLDLQSNAETDLSHLKTKIGFTPKDPVIDEVFVPRLEFESARSESFSKDDLTVAHSNILESGKILPVSARQTPAINSLQLLILAVVAGFFYSLGANLKLLTIS